MGFGPWIPGHKKSSTELFGPPTFVRILKLIFLSDIVIGATGIAALATDCSCNEFHQLAKWQKYSNSWKNGDCTALKMSQQL